MLAYTLPGASGTGEDSRLCGDEDSLQMYGIFKPDSADFMGSHHYLINETSLV